MAVTFKLLSTLLAYPTEDLQQAVDELRERLATDGILDGRVLRALDPLLTELAHDDLYDLQERYVLLFDRSRSLSLHLFEHVHGESRDRGQAMIDLKHQYEQQGLYITATELPDFLPLFLEFLSTLPVEVARDQLAQPVHILAALAERLRKRQSPYEAVFRALMSLTGVPAQPAAVAQLLDQPDTDPLDLAVLDAAWEAEPVTFGPNTSNCKDDLVARLRAAKRPAPPIGA